MVSEQMMEMPLPVGSHVVLLEDADRGEDGSVVGEVIFVGVVEQYIPNTGLLRFEDRDIGRAEFQELLQQADGYEVTQ